MPVIIKFTINLTTAQRRGIGKKIEYKMNLILIKITYKLAT